MPIEVKAYRCPHCGKGAYLKRNMCLKHEAQCEYNPAVKACKICLHNPYDHTFRVPDECQHPDADHLLRKRHWRYGAMHCEGWKGKGATDVAIQEKE